MSPNYLRFVLTPGNYGPWLADNQSRDQNTSSDGLFTCIGPVSHPLQWLTDSTSRMNPAWLILVATLQTTALTAEEVVFSSAGTIHT